MKLYDMKSEYVTLVDEFGVKEFVRKVAGDKYVVPTINVWERPEDIDWSTLPLRFALKTTHDSGGIVIYRDKNHIDFRAVNSFLTERMRPNYFYKIWRL